MAHCGRVPQPEEDVMKVKQLSVDEILHEATSLYDRWPSLRLWDNRKIAESLIEPAASGLPSGGVPAAEGQHSATVFRRN